MLVIWYCFFQKKNEVDNIEKISKLKNSNIKINVKQLVRQGSNKNQSKRLYKNIKKSLLILSNVVVFIKIEVTRIKNVQIKNLLYLY